VDRSRYITIISSIEWSEFSRKQVSITRYKERMSDFFENFYEVHPEGKRTTTHIERMDDLSIKYISDTLDYTWELIACSDGTSHV